MGKSRNYDREYTLIERLKKENAELKRTVAKIRRQMDRLNIDHDRYRTLRELIHQQVQEERQSKKSKRDWTCHSCGKGLMKIYIFTRRDGTFYFRRCTMEDCNNQTKLQKYSEGVEES